MIAAMEITEDTPMTMPNTVKAERTLDDRSVSMAARKFSRACAGVIMVISQTSRLQLDPAAMRAPLDRFRKTIQPRNSRLLLESRPTSGPRLGKAGTCAAPAPPRI